MHIFLVDDNDTFRKNLKLFLEGHLNHVVVGEANNGKAFIENKVFADLVLMDINMPGMNGLEATKRGTWIYNKLKIIAVSQFTDSVDLHQLICAGFKGFVSKTNLFRDLEKAISTVYQGAFFFPDDLKLSNADEKAQGLISFQNEY